MQEEQVVRAGTEVVIDREATPQTGYFSSWRT
jgi:hypothetical protein